MSTSLKPRLEATLENLRAAFHSLWRFGSNALVGWTPTAGGIEVALAPRIRLFEVKSPHRRVFTGSRQMGRTTFGEVSRSLDVQPIELRLDHPLGDQPNALSFEAVEQMFMAFAVTRTEQRAVFLIDIVGFSKVSPERQATQLSTLSFALNLTNEMARAQGITLTMRRSTTGDGFYVWNADVGVVADESLFIGLILFLVFFSALRRTVVLPDAVPNIRIAASIGSHYTYHEPNPGGGDSTEFIVGEVTISVARLISATRPHQILVGDFRRTDVSAQQAYGIETFLQRVAKRLAFLSSIQVLDSRVERISAYFTGGSQADKTYVAHRLAVRDKHGFEHRCYNLKVNIYPDSGKPYFCGLQHEDIVQKAKQPG